MPFVAIAVFGLLLCALAWRVLPRMRGHLQGPERPAIRAMLAADDAQNRGTVNSRGQAAAARLANLVNRDARGEVA
jgi:hypothetical protein